MSLTMLPALPSNTRNCALQSRLHLYCHVASRTFRLECVPRRSQVFQVGARRRSRFANIWDADAAMKIHEGEPLRKKCKEEPECAFCGSRLRDHTALRICTRCGELGCEVCMDDGICHTCFVLGDQEGWEDRQGCDLHAHEYQNKPR